MELIKYGENVLPAKSQEILKALESPLVLNSSDEIVKDQITKSMLRAYFDLGFSYPSDSDFPVMVHSILNNVRMEGMALRLDEIPIAFSRGILKEYGDFIGLSVASFSGFIKSYIMNNARLEALKEKNKPSDQRKEPTQEEKFNIAKDNALRAFNDVKEGRDISLYGSVVYDFLNGLKLIDIPNEEKYAFIEQARNELIREREMKRAGLLDRVKLIDINKELESLNKKDQSIEILVMKRAKCLTLVSWMQGLIFEEVELERMIKNAHL